MKFTPLKKFNIKVPDNYDHDTQLATFKDKHLEEYDHYNPNITDQNFNKVSNKLEAGKEYEVKIWGINRRATSKECINKIKKENGLLVGAQGLSLVFEQKRDELIRNKWYLSFDEADNLWEDSVGNHRVTYVRASSDGDFYFNLGYLERDWGVDGAFLSFSDVSPKKLKPLKSKTLDPLEICGCIYTRKYFWSPLICERCGHKWGEYN